MVKELVEPVRNKSYRSCLKYSRIDPLSITERNEEIASEIWRRFFGNQVKDVAIEARDSFVNKHHFCLFRGFNVVMWSYRYNAPVYGDNVSLLEGFIDAGPGLKGTFINKGSVFVFESISEELLKYNNHPRFKVI